MGQAEACAPIQSVLRAWHPFDRTITIILTEPGQFTGHTSTFDSSFNNQFMSKAK